MQAMKFMVDAFISPGAPACWVVLFLSFMLIITIPVVAFTTKDVRIHLATQFSSLLPLVIGLLGTLYSLDVAHSALQQVPEAFQAQAGATGRSVSMSTIFFSTFPTIILWIIALFSILLSRKVFRSKVQVEVKNRYYEFWLFLIAIVGIPILVALSIWIFGKIVCFDAMANVPAPQRAQATESGIAIMNTASLIWLFSLVSIPVLYLGAAKKRVEPVLKVQ